MQIHLSDITFSEGKTIQETVKLEMDKIVFQLGEFPVLKKSPVELTVSNTGDKVLEIRGEGTVTVGIPCDRCLTPVKVDFYLDVDSSIDMNQSEEERAADLDEQPYISGNYLDVDQLVRNELLLNLPMKVLCREDCKGICNRCGANLNYETCECDKSTPDPRMSVIQDIFKQFKEV